MGKKGIRYLLLLGVGLHFVQETARHRGSHWGRGLSAERGINKVPAPSYGSVPRALAGPAAGQRAVG